MRQAPGENSTIMGENFQLSKQHKQREQPLADRRQLRIVVGGVDRT